MQNSYFTIGHDVIMLFSPYASSLIHKISLASLIMLSSAPTPPISISISISPDIINYILVGIYDVLTFALFGVTLWSFRSSVKQSQEIIYNQSKPILVCANVPPSNPDDLTNLAIKNVGAGAATNVRCLISFKLSSKEQNPQLILMPKSVLAVNEGDTAQRHPTLAPNTCKKIGDYSCFPESTETTHNIRFIMTYRDIFNRKHLSIFDGKSSVEWSQVTIKDFDYELDEPSL